MKSSINLTFKCICKLFEPDEPCPECVMRAVQSFECGELQNMLVDGLDANMKINGVPLVSHAIAAGRLDSVHELLAYGADPEARSCHNFAPLEYTSHTNFGQQMQLFLLAAGAQFTCSPLLLSYVVDQKRVLRSKRLKLLRTRALEVCVALQNLRLPALVTVEIMEHVHSVAPFVPFHTKWHLTTAVKHWRERRSAQK